MTTAPVRNPDSTPPPLVAKPAEADPHRAISAVEWALERARRAAAGPAVDAPSAGAHGRLTCPVAAHAIDFRAAAESYRSDLRGRLDQLLMSDDAEAGLDGLLACGALSALLPEVEAMVGFGDGEWRHKDVWKHTKQVVRQAVPRLEIRWSALLHDIGKTRTRSISPTGEVHFFGHAEVGARMFDKLNRRVPLFRDEDSLRETVRFLILNHLRAAQYEASWTDSAVRRFAKEMGDHLDDLLCLSRADITTKRPEKKKHGLRQISELSARVQTITEEDAVVPPLPTGVGTAIMEAFALPPSKLVGAIKKQLEECVEAGEITPHQPSEAYVAFVAANRVRFGLPAV
ncbi:MAG: HDIG domain-containing protein [Polyangiaceae bacterium]